MSMRMTTCTQGQGVPRSFSGTRRKVSRFSRTRPSRLGLFGSIKKIVSRGVPAKPQDPIKSVPLEYAMSVQMAWQDVQSQTSLWKRVLGVFNRRTPSFADRALGHEGWANLQSELGELDRSHLEQLEHVIFQSGNPNAAVRELINNSFDYTDASQAVHVRAQDGFLEVLDFGPGMSKDVITSKLIVKRASGSREDKDKQGQFGVGFNTAYRYLVSPDFNGDGDYKQHLIEGAKVVVHTKDAKSGEVFEVVFFVKNQDVHVQITEIQDPSHEFNQFLAGKVSATRIRIWSPAIQEEAVENQIHESFRFHKRDIQFNGQSFSKLQISQTSSFHIDGFGSVSVGLAPSKQRAVTITVNGTTVESWLIEDEAHAIDGELVIDLPAKPTKLTQIRESVYIDENMLKVFEVILRKCQDGEWGQDPQEKFRIVNSLAVWAAQIEYSGRSHIKPKDNRETHLPKVLAETVSDSVSDSLRLYPDMYPFENFPDVLRVHEAALPENWKDRFEKPKGDFSAVYLKGSHHQSVEILLCPELGRETPFYFSKELGVLFLSQEVYEQESLSDLQALLRKTLEKTPHTQLILSFQETKSQHVIQAPQAGLEKSPVTQSRFSEEDYTQVKILRSMAMAGIELNDVSLLASSTERVDDYKKLSNGGLVFQVRHDDPGTGDIRRCRIMYAGSEDQQDGWVEVFDVSRVLLNSTMPYRFHTSVDRYGQPVFVYGSVDFAAVTEAGEVVRKKKQPGSDYRSAGMVEGLGIVYQEEDGIKVFDSRGETLDPFLNQYKEIHLGSWSGGNYLVVAHDDGTIDFLRFREGEFVKVVERVDVVVEGHLKWFKRNKPGGRKQVSVELKTGEVVSVPEDYGIDSDTNVQLRGISNRDDGALLFTHKNGQDLRNYLYRNGEWTRLAEFDGRHILDATCLEDDTIVYNHNHQIVVYQGQVVFTGSAVHKMLPLPNSRLLIKSNDSQANKIGTIVDLESGRVESRISKGDNLRVLPDGSFTSSSKTRISNKYDPDSGAVRHGYLIWHNQGQKFTIQSPRKSEYLDEGYMTDAELGSVIEDRFTNRYERCQVLYSHESHSFARPALFLEDQAFETLLNRPRGEAVKLAQRTTTRIAIAILNRYSEDDFKTLKKRLDVADEFYEAGMNFDLFLNRMDVVFSRINVRQIRRGRGMDPNVLREFFRNPVDTPYGQARLKVGQSKAFRLSQLMVVARQGQIQSSNDIIKQQSRSRQSVDHTQATIKHAVSHLRNSHPCVWIREYIQNIYDELGNISEAERRRLDVDVFQDDQRRIVSRFTDFYGMNDVAFRAVLDPERSTKSGDPGKIGRFGIGFFSSLWGADQVVIKTCEKGSDVIRQARLVPLRDDKGDVVDVDISVEFVPNESGFYGTVIERTEQPAEIVDLAYSQHTSFLKDYLKYFDPKVLLGTLNGEVVSQGSDPEFVTQTARLGEVAVHSGLEDALLLSAFKFGALPREVKEGLPEVVRSFVSGGIYFALDHQRFPVVPNRDEFRDSQRARKALVEELPTVILQYFLKKVLDPNDPTSMDQLPTHYFNEMTSLANQGELSPQIIEDGLRISKGQSAADWSLYSGDQANRNVLKLLTVIPFIPVPDEDRLLSVQDIFDINKKSRRGDTSARNLMRKILPNLPYELKERLDAVKSKEGRIERSVQMLRSNDVTLNRIFDLDHFPSFTNLDTASVEQLLRIYDYLWKAYFPGGSVQVSTKIDMLSARAYVHMNPIIPDHSIYIPLSQKLLEDAKRWKEIQSISSPVQKEDEAREFLSELHRTVIHEATHLLTETADRPDGTHDLSFENSTIALSLGLVPDYPLEVKGILEMFSDETSMG